MTIIRESINYLLINGSSQHCGEVTQLHLPLCVQHLILDSGLRQSALVLSVTGGVCESNVEALHNTHKVLIVLSAE